MDILAPSFHLTKMYRDQLETIYKNSKYIIKRKSISIKWDYYQGCRNIPLKS